MWHKFPLCCLQGYVTARIYHTQQGHISWRESYTPGKRAVTEARPLCTSKYLAELMLYHDANKPKQTPENKKQQTTKQKQQKRNNQPNKQQTDSDFISMFY